MANHSGLGLAGSSSAVTTETITLSDQEEDGNINRPSQIHQEKETTDDYCKRIMGLLKLCQKYSNALQGWQHYSDYSGVHLTMTRVNKLLNSLMIKIFNHQDIKLNINGFKLSDQFDIIREGNDSLLERINSDVDEAGGFKRNTGIEILEPAVRTIRGPVNQATGREVVLLASRTVQKPQMFFSPKIDNSAKEPFIPLLKEKPNSLKPLSILVCVDKSTDREYYSHPYEYELQQWSPSEKFLTRPDPIAPRPISETPLVMVESETALQEMVQDLKNVEEFAVDVENHSFRSYQGLTCLIQISTRDKDFIIDPFPLRNHLSVLNEVFTDPKIAKVFHGAVFDIEWLQRDCGIYVVNMFDTHQAACVLQYPHKSLATLLSTFCRVEANKSYQRADWRIRPLPEDFIHYARQDTHFLLYVKDILINELIDKGNELNNLLHAVYSRSTELCLKRYEKPCVLPDSHMDLYRRSRKQFNSRQMYALQKLYQWRDKIARDQDESVDYVLPKHMLLQIAEVLPKEIQGILACCNPVPLLVKTEQLTLHQIIRAARELPLEEVNPITSTTQTTSLAQVDSASDARFSLVCRHDLSLIEENTLGLSTLLKPQESLLGDLFTQYAVNVTAGKISFLFGMNEDSLRCKKTNLNQITHDFMSPFERYNTLLKHEDIQKMSKLDKKNATTTDDNQDRIDKVKAHFLSLTKNSSTSESNVNSEVDSSQSDLERMNRLQEHIASLVSSEKEKKPKKKKLKAKEKKNNATNQNQVTPAGGKPKKSNKRKSLDENDSATKKMKSENDENDSEENDSGIAVEPFDYSKANFEMFRSKAPVKKFKKTFRQFFKGKKSNNVPGMNNSKIKSLSWGARKSL